MKVIILCGGIGTRLREETEFKPKPLVEIGGRPILWHIMKIYAHYGFNEFILTLGYKGHMIKDYFLRHRVYANDFTLDTNNNKVIFHQNGVENFSITFVDTKPDTLTGERIRRVQSYITEDRFMVTYGDGLGDIDITGLLNFHKQKNTIGTITGVKPLSRYGVMLTDPHDQHKIVEFHQSDVVGISEHARKLQEWKHHYFQDHINGGFMVFEREIFDYILPNSMIEEAFVPLAKQGQLSLYSHPGQWKSMDTYRDMEELNNLSVNDPFWKVWEVKHG